MPHRCTCEHGRDEGDGRDSIPMICLKCGGEWHERLDFDPLVPKQANNQSADGQFAAIEFEA